MTANHRLALSLTWATRADDHTPAADTRELLAMCGLIEPGGRVLLPDDDRNYDIEAASPVKVAAGMSRADKQGRRHELAREVCSTCPVVNDCYAEGRTRKEEGVWGKRLMPKKKSGPPYISTGIVRRRVS